MDCGMERMCIESLNFLLFQAFINLVVNLFIQLFIHLCSFIHSFIRSFTFMYSEFTVPVLTFMTNTCTVCEVLYVVRGQPEVNTCMWGSICCAWSTWSLPRGGGKNVGEERGTERLLLLLLELHKSGCGEITASLRQRSEVRHKSLHLRLLLLQQHRRSWREDNQISEEFNHPNESLKEILGCII